MMRVAVFRNGTTFPEYPPEQLRTKALLPTDTDELEAVQRYMSDDPGLKNFVAVVNDTDLPPDGGMFNSWRHNGTAVVVDMPLAADCRLACLLAQRDTIVAKLQVQVERAGKSKNTNAAWLKGLTDKLTALKSLDKTLGDACAAAQTPQALLAVTDPSLHQ